jgi:uncharacterized protein (TIGR02246 family)
MLDRRLAGKVGSWFVMLALSRAPSSGLAQDATAGNESSTAEAAVRTVTDEFVAAFNGGDAPAVAALWTSNGDYIDEQGQRTSGREAIEARYAAFFKQHPGSKIDLVNRSIRPLNADTVIEDGQSVVGSASPEVAGTSRYTAVYVRQDGRWLIASVRDTESASNTRLEDLAWLVGSWTAEHEGTELQLEFQPIADGAFIEATFTTRREGKVAASGKQITGVDPSNGQINSWIFNSDGSLAHGVWRPSLGGWAADFAGVTANGEPTTAHNVLTKLDDNAFSWKSEGRSAAGIALPDTDEVVVRRKKKSPG